MKKSLAPLLISLCVTVPFTASAVSPARHGGDGGVVLRASVGSGSIVNTGDRLTFSYQTRKDAAVLVFSIDSRGFVHLLHPVGGPAVSAANADYTIPEYGNELVVDTPGGVEFAFAVAVSDPSAIDAAELDHLRGTDYPGAEPYRISGDPFIAANMIAAELVRGISHEEVYFGYTYFYVNQRVAYPCYLCGACDGAADDMACSDYRVVQNFDRSPALRYPLRRGYDMVESGADIFADGGASFDVPDGSDVNVNFYPYGSEVRYVDPSWYVYPSGWGWWDPFYWYWPGYYPYCGSGWGISIGWGWGWGGWGWGGYYCSGWYAPPCYYSPCYPSHYPSGGYPYAEKFKTKYRSGDTASGMLTAQRARAAQRDGSLRIAQKDVQNSVTRSYRSSITKSTRSATRATYLAGRSGTPRVKTSVYGTSRGTGSAYRSPGNSGTKSPRVIRGTPTKSRSSSGTVRSGATRPSRGSSGAVRKAPASPRGSDSGVKRGSSARPRSSSGVKTRGSSGASRPAPAARGGSGGTARGGSRPAKSR